MKSKKLFTSIVLISSIFLITKSTAQEVISVKKYSNMEIAKIVGDQQKEKPGIEALKIVYSSTRHDGTKTKASGLLLIPKNVILKKAPIAIYGHGMTSKKQLVPSELTFQAEFAASFALNGYITIAADYYGLGENPGVQPYLHAESYALSVLDMLRAVRKYFKKKLKTKLRDDIYLTGYSDGGLAAMATHKYIEENNLTTEFKINASAPCSGAYSLSKVMYDYVMKLNKMQYCDPEIMIHVYIGLQSIYKNLYKQTGDFFKAPYDSIIDNYIKNDCNFDLNKQFPVQMNQFIHDSIFVNFEKDPNHPFRVALQKNDTYNWRPKAPIKMYYTKADIKVPYQNAIMAEATMKKLGVKNVEAIQVSETLEHSAAMWPILKLVLEWFNGIESKKVI